MKYSKTILLLYYNDDWFCFRLRKKQKKKGLKKSKQESGNGNKVETLLILSFMLADA